MKDLLLITPPFTQLNTPYPATAYIKGFLNTKNISSHQVDLGIEVILALFSKNGIKNIFEKEINFKTISINAQRIFSLREEYIKTIDQVILFLQNKNPTLARQICTMNFLPEASRFNQLDDMEFAFGNMGLQDKAKHLATLYLEDISDYIIENIDADFGFSRYAEKIGQSANSFDELYAKLNNNETYTDAIALKILKKKLDKIQPKLVCFSVPFPGNLYSAFRCAQYIKKHFPKMKIAMGGGFPNTELRKIKDKRVFEFFDFITLDDGELPIELIIKNLEFYSTTFDIEDSTSLEELQNSTSFESEDSPILKELQKSNNFIGVDSPPLEGLQNSNNFDGVNSPPLEGWQNSKNFDGVNSPPLEGWQNSKNFDVVNSPPLEGWQNSKNFDGVVNEFKRTFLIENEEIIYKNNSTKQDYKQSQIGTPDYTDLQLDLYISVIEIANPMHSLWSDGRWNKLTMAHGCYWGKCTFCDISLDYIKIYEPISAKILVDRMQELIAQTGESGFHFVDEAAPPALMREVALEILRRNLVVTWWTNIRFEKSFTKDLCFLLKISGCIAVSGGLEVASDRLLKLIDKGVSVEQVAKVTRNFTEAGIMVHSYLMYGYPTQTLQETVDSLEMVRQFFEMGIIQSGFWHQFALTAHSPIGKNPEEFGLTPIFNEISFAHNDVEFIDKTSIDHNKFSFGLKKSLLNYMHGINFDLRLQDWFDFKIPKTTIHQNYIHDCLLEEENFNFRGNAKLLFFGKNPQIENFTKTKKGKSKVFSKLIFHLNTNIVEVELEKNTADWLVNVFKTNVLQNSKTLQLQEFKINYEENFDDFELFWFSKPMQKLKENGVILCL